MHIFDRCKSVGWPFWSSSWRQSTVPACKAFVPQDTQLTLPFQLLNSLFISEVPNTENFCTPRTFNRAHSENNTVNYKSTCANKLGTCTFLKTLGLRRWGPRDKMCTSTVSQRRQAEQQHWYDMGCLCFIPIAIVCLYQGRIISNICIISYLYTYTLYLPLRWKLVTDVSIPSPV